jgi:predicted  nucleic acid-binding Zn-ribbon protein
MSNGMSPLDLAALQQVDLDLERTLHEIATLTAALGSEQALVAARARLEAAAQVEAAARTALRDAENDLADTEKRIALNEERLRSGVITSAQALEKVEHELTHLRAAREEQEEEALEAMEAHDRAQAAAQAAKAALAETEQARAVEREQQQTQLAAARQRREELVTQRGTVAASIDAGHLARYESIRKTRGRAVVPVVGGICQGCRVALQAAIVHRVRASSDELVTCTNCGRILIAG